MNSGLLFLTIEDFYVQKHGEKTMFSHRIPGFSLILYYSDFCDGCAEFITVFNTLPGTIEGCKFGKANVDLSKREYMSISQKTFTPIKYVPYIILYIDGRPFMSYNGPPNRNEIVRFIMECVGSVQKKQQFTQGKVQEKGASAIPEYTIGRPVTGDKKQIVCYLEFSTAYVPQQKAQ